MNGDIVFLGKFDGPDLQHLRTQAGHLKHFVIRDLREFAGLRTEAGIRCINPVHVGIDFTHVRPECGGDGNPRRIRSAPAQGGNVVRLVHSLKSCNHNDPAFPEVLPDFFRFDTGNPGFSKGAVRFDFDLISKTFADYGVSLSDLAAVAVAVFDHGNAPAGISDRQFRFDYLDARIKLKNSLSAFGYLSTDIPKIMTRLQAVADSAPNLPCPLVVMDTAPAAVLGANFDSTVAKRKQKIICNVGNFHTLAFRLGEKGIEGVFEHHTGEIDLPKLESLLRRLADGSLKHQDVFDDMGHGALMYTDKVFEFGKDDFDLVVTGPRRSMFQTTDRGPKTESRRPSSTVLRPYFAAPFGDMMIAGCFGLLAAVGEILPDVTEAVFGSLRSGQGRGIAPWDG